MREVALPSKCALFRNGVEIWIPEGEKLQKLENIIDNLQSHLFFAWEGRRMNTADLTGIYLPIDMEIMHRQKKGEWTCEKGTWHTRNQICSCKAETPEWTPEHEGPYVPPDSSKLAKVIRDAKRKIGGEKDDGS